MQRNATQQRRRSRKWNFEPANEREQRSTLRPAEPGRAEGASERAASIRAIIAERQIGALFHFTRAEHLPGISEHGVVPRQTLENLNLPFEQNDNERWDHAPDASCVSISWPNFRTFCTFRYTRFPETTWAVLEMAPDVLWELECAFCHTNAASGCVSHLTRRDRSTASALAGLFSDHDGGPSRSECAILSSYPTDPQAEVLVFGTIPPGRVRCAYVENILAMRRVPSANRIPVRVDARYFGQRSDHGVWTEHHASHREGDA